MILLVQEEARPEAAAHLTFPALCLLAALLLLLTVICWTSDRYLSFFLYQFNWVSLPLQMSQTECSKHCRPHRHWWRKEARRPPMVATYQLLNP